GWLVMSDACGGNEACSARTEAPAAQRRGATAVGTIWGVSKPGGLNIKKDCSLEKGVRQEIVLTGKCGKADLDRERGKADDGEQETGTCTPRTAVTGVQATREGFAEIRSSRQH